MRIGINCRTILNPDSGEKAGVGHYTHYIVKYLTDLDKKNEYVLFFDNRVPKSVIEKVIGSKEKDNVKIDFLPFYQYKRFMPVMYTHMLLAGFLKKQNLDLYFSPGAFIPLYYDGPSVITVHDLAIYKNPKWFPSRLGPGQLFSTKILVPKSVENAIGIIVPSESTKKDLIEIFKVSEKKITVIYEGSKIDKEDKDKLPTLVELKKKFLIPNKYIFFIGTIEPRKNLSALMTAFFNLKRNGRLKDYKLVIAGADGWKNEREKKLMKKYNKMLAEKKKLTPKDEQIKYLGYVLHREKIALLKHSTCFVYPSFYEGFGLPVLEAMVCRTPVITSNVSSIPEITGDNAILIDPNNTKEIEKAIEKLTSNEKLRQDLAERAKKQSEKFTWEKCAKETLDLFKELENKIVNKKKK